MEMVQKVTRGWTIRRNSVDEGKLLSAEQVFLFLSVKRINTMGTKWFQRGLVFPFFFFARKWYNLSLLHLEDPQTWDFLIYPVNFFFLFSLKKNFPNPLEQNPNLWPFTPSVFQGPLCTSISGPVGFLVAVSRRCEGHCFIRTMAAFSSLLPCSPQWRRRPCVARTKLFSALWTTLERHMHPAAKPAVRYGSSWL